MREAGKPIPLLTIAEAAKRVRVSERTISTWVRDGLIPAIPDGNRRLIPIDHLTQMIQDRDSYGGRKPRKDKGTLRHAN